ncbi:hypothetical protein TNCT_16071 [Trichonephila clavata]|uniref:Uncharacterized protein n=1 Tax=Trichonephila clavata TaxID=2740835 RepID=A0A8X6KHW4_TRICU|nr:hypothetical protein TNCT_16071 [Trichonephila clavata]
MVRCSRKLITAIRESDSKTSLPENPIFTEIGENNRSLVKVRSPRIQNNGKTPLSAAHFSFSRAIVIRVVLISEPDVSDLDPYSAVRRGTNDTIFICPKPPDLIQPSVTPVLRSSRS